MLKKYNLFKNISITSLSKSNLFKFATIYNDNNDNNIDSIPKIKKTRKTKENIELLDTNILKCHKSNESKDSTKYNNKSINNIMRNIKVDLNKSLSKLNNPKSKIN